MTARSLTRASFVAGMLGLSALVVAPDAVKFVADNGYAAVNTVWPGIGWPTAGR